ncbi:MAG: hypothetical protein ABIO71_13590 [Caldimonas sp.]
MRLTPCLTFAATLVLPVLAHANCYSVYDAQNRLAFQSNEAPIDLSRRISDAMASRFPGSYLVMIPDESACREVRSGPVVRPRFDALGLGASPNIGERALQTSPLLRGTRVTGEGGGPQPSDVASREAVRNGNSLNIKRDSGRARP